MENPHNFPPNRNMVRNSRGRQRILTDRPRVSQIDRSVTFVKRRNGIYKSMSDMSILCGSDFSIMMISETGKLFTFSHPSFESVAGQLGIGHDEASQSEEASTRARVSQLTQQLAEVTIGVNHELERKKRLKERAREQPMMHNIVNAPIDDLSGEDVQMLEEWLRDVQARVLQRINELHGNNMNLNLGVPNQDALVLSNPNLGVPNQGALVFTNPNLGAPNQDALGFLNPNLSALDQGTLGFTNPNFTSHNDQVNLGIMNLNFGVPHQAAHGFMSPNFGASDQGVQLGFMDPNWVMPIQAAHGFMSPNFGPPVQDDEGFVNPYFGAPDQGSYGLVNPNFDRLEELGGYSFMNPNFDGFYELGANNFMNPNVGAPDQGARNFVNSYFGASDEGAHGGDVAH